MKTRIKDINVFVIFQVSYSYKKTVLKILSVKFLDIWEFSDIWVEYQMFLSINSSRLSIPRGG